MSRSLEIVIFLLPFFLVAIFSGIGASQNDQCTVSKCKHHGPAIRFPFLLKGHQPDHCGYPGFDLYCDEKDRTVLELPSLVKLLVKNIDYKSQEIHVYDQKHCLSKQLQYLNLSASPFQFQQPQYLKNYTFFNCSPTYIIGNPNLKNIPCLSTFGYQVNTIFSNFEIAAFFPLSCIKIYNISSVPEDIFFQKYVHLNWINPICGHCEAEGKKCRLKKKNDNSTEPVTECFDIVKLSKGSTITGKVIAGAILGFFLLVLIIFVFYKAHNLDKKERENQVKIEKFLEDYKALKPTRYSYADIKRITNQFKEKLGQGGYGIVFKEKLSSEILVAVKILNSSTGNGDEFINEVGTMGRIHHVNVVRLVGFCADGSKRAVVYEFLPNESLEKFIFSIEEKKYLLNWEKLQDIAIGIAKGIEYLHQGCDRQILHFDIKPHNILLDHNYCPKISDFGLAKLCSKGQSVVSMTAARGTMGYIAPEVLSRNFGNVSYKSNVYSFGMLLLEIVGGRKNIDIKVENSSQVYFPEWVYNRLDQGEELRIRVEKERDAKIAKKLTIVGLWCIQWHPVDRPLIKVAVQMLEGNEDKLTMPPNPFASTIPTNSTAIIPEGVFSTELAVIPE